MTQTEYLAAKKKKYQEYKAGAITNYAYIQWKKKNDPSLNPGGASSSPAKQPMTDKEYATFSQLISKKFMDGDITLAEYNKLTHDLNEYKWGAGKGTSGADVKAALGLSGSSSKSAAKTVEQAAEEKVQKQLEKVYKEAQKDLKNQLKEFTAAFQAKDAEMQAQLSAGEITQAQYDNWKKGQVFQSDLWKKKIDQVTGVLADANGQALQIINKQKMGVFAESANYQAYQLTQDTGLNLSFAIYDQDAVGRLVRDRPELLPRKELNGKKDRAWNKTKIANTVAQSIIQGESIPELAERIARDTASENGSAMMRYARTAMVSAQNAGRIETLERAKAMGIKCRKKWLATLDSRTRDAHQELDGQTVEVDQPFVTHNRDGSLAELQFPGDPSADPEQVYNCRCTLIYVYDEYPNDPEFEQRRDNETGQLIQNMSYPEWKSAKEGSALNDLNQAKVELAQAQKAFAAGKVDESHVYHNIWKDDVTLADYPSKKGSIQAKEDYYQAEIDKIKTAQANGESWATDAKLKDKEKQLSELKQFEKQGKLLEARNAALKKVQAIYDQVGYQKIAQAPDVEGENASGSEKATTIKGRFAPDAWTEEVKKAARNFAHKEEADSALRPELDAIWDNLSDEEKYGVWLYTWNSNPMNKPLSGHHDSWDRSYAFVGYENAVWGHEDNYSNRNISSCGEMGRFARRDGHAEYMKGIVYTTNAIEKSELQDGQWLVRGSDENGLAGWFAGAGMDFDSVTSLFDGSHTEKDLQNALIWQRAKNHAFTSTAIARDAGFPGNVKYRIYAPRGTKGIYAEPQSHYGDTTGGYMGSPVARSKRDTIYRKGASCPSIGGEAEIIIQRGTTYRVTGVRETGRDWRGKPSIEIEMEVVDQPDYFQHGDEDTYNDGKTRHKK